MPGPLLPSYAARLYQALQPLAYDDASQGYALAYLCKAIGAMYQPVCDLVEDTAAGPGWSPLMDVARCPLFALPWLAQLVGVTLTDPSDDAGSRAEIRAAAGFSRGTVAAMKAAAAATLTGDDPTVIFRERDGSAYRLTVLTRTSETPDEAATLAALTAQKPAGIVLTYLTIPDWTYGDLHAAYTTYSDVHGAYTTYRGVHTNDPGT